MRMRQPPTNRPRYYSSYTSYDENGNGIYMSIQCNGFSYRNPITKSGKYRQYFKFMLDIYNNPGITRFDIIKKHYPDSIFVVSKNYLNTYFSGFSADGYTLTSTKGNLYPTEKLINYVEKVLKSSIL